jgi:hypothetical protein
MGFGGLVLPTLVIMMQLQQSILCIAVVSGSTAVVQALLTAGARVDELTVRGAVRDEPCCRLGAFRGPFAYSHTVSFLR